MLPYSERWTRRRRIAVRCVLCASLLSGAALVRRSDTDALQPHGGPHNPHAADVQYFAPVGRRLIVSAKLDNICHGRTDYAGWQAALYMLGVLYVLIGMAIVYDEFLQGALVRLGEAMHLSHHVTAATVAVAGACSPRLFVVLADAFGTKGGDTGIGVATVIGAGVFNITAFIGLSAAAVTRHGAPVSLDWRPIVRDAGFMFAAAFLLGVAVLTGGHSVIRWWESVYLWAVFPVYVAFASQWSRISALCTSPKIADYHDHEQLGSHAADPLTLEAGTKPASVPHGASPSRPGDANANNSAAAAALPGASGNSSIAVSENKPSLIDPELTGHEGEAENGGSTPHASGGDERIDPPAPLLASANFRRSSMTLGVRHRAERRRTSSVGPGGAGSDPNTSDSRRLSAALAATAAATNAGPITSADGAVTASSALQHAKKAEPARVTSTASSNYPMPEEMDRFSWPESMLDRTLYVLAFPFLVVLSATIPDCSQPGLERWFAATLILALAWTGVLAFFMTEWAAIAACAMGIQPSVLGFIYPALGTSLPDALGAAIAVREGAAATASAVVGALSASIFDLTMGLGLPWVLKNIAGHGLHVYWRLMGVSLIILLCGLPCLLAILALARWRLTQEVGLVLRLLYIAYVGYIIIDATI